jgi:hypothetical protein
MTLSILTKNQKQVFTKNIIWEGKPHIMKVTLRYDDECNNGHNTFSITGEIRKIGNYRDCEIGGCIHDEIAKYFPEFKHLIKWHLTSSDEPMHYIANTTYWAKDREYMDKAIGEPVKFEKALKFKNIPLIFNFKNNFYDFISSVKKWDDVKIVTLEHKKSDYPYSPKYTFEGTSSTEWCQGEFDTIQKATEWLEMFKTFDFDIIEIPIKWNEVKEPNLKNARSCAIWEDATLEQLQSEMALKKRLPKLMKEFKKDIEKLGFIY